MLLIPPASFTSEVTQPFICIQTQPEVGRENESGGFTLSLHLGMLQTHQPAQGSCKSGLCRKGGGTSRELHKATLRAGPMLSFKMYIFFSVRAETAACIAMKKKIPMPGLSFNHEFLFLRAENL